MREPCEIANELADFFEFTVERTLGLGVLLEIDVEVYWRTRQWCERELPRLNRLKADPFTWPAIFVFILFVRAMYFAKLWLEARRRRQEREERRRLREQRLQPTQAFKPTQLWFAWKNAGRLLGMLKARLREVWIWVSGLWE